MLLIVPKMTADFSLRENCEQPAVIRAAQQASQQQQIINKHRESS